jgi:transcriptional regulator with XRE-family HTH domain
LSRSPAASRRLLGAELRSIRDAAGLRIEDAAVRLECSAAKIGRLESGKGKPKVRDVRDLLELYGVTDQMISGRLLALAVEAQEQDYLSDFRDVVHGDMFDDHLLQYVTLERDSSVLKQYEVDLIPGLLQTPEYTDAVCGSVFPERSQRERERFVEFRQARQELLHRQPEPPEVSFIVNELAIVRPVTADVAIQRHQLEVLHARLVDDLEYVDFRILPLVVPAPDALGGPISIIKFSDADQDVVYLEGRRGATYLETSADVARYEEKFSNLERLSLSRSDSLEGLIAKIEMLRSA